jgi:hypothetical protein
MSATASSDDNGSLIGNPRFQSVCTMRADFIATDSALVGHPHEIPETRERRIALNRPTS